MRFLSNLVHDNKFTPQDVPKFENKLFIVNDGQEALDFLFHRGRYEDKCEYPRPDIVLLDINMPKMDGIEVLKSIKDDLELNFIPVIMLTSSKEEEDIVGSYRAGASSFMQKPVGYEEFVKFVDGFNTYWHTINKLPNPDICKDKDKDK